MDVNAIATFIEQFGFPIVLSAVLLIAIWKMFVYFNNKMDKSEEEHKEEVRTMNEEHKAEVKEMNDQHKEQMKQIINSIGVKVDAILEKLKGGDE